MPTSLHSYLYFLVEYMGVMHDILDDSVSRVILIVAVMVMSVPLLRNLATVELLCYIFKVLLDFCHILKQFS